MNTTSSTIPRCLIADEHDQITVPQPFDHSEPQDDFSLEGLHSQPVSPYKRRLIVVIAAIECFFAPISILSGMTASQGDYWKLFFVG